MEDQQGEIRIYVACLAAYNNGILHGCWIDAEQEPDEIRSGINEMLKASPIAGAHTASNGLAICSSRLRTKPSTPAAKPASKLRLSAC